MNNSYNYYTNYFYWIKTIQLKSWSNKVNFDQKWSKICKILINTGWLLSKIDNWSKMVHLGRKFVEHCSKWFTLINPSRKLSKIKWQLVKKLIKHSHLWSRMIKNLSDINFKKSTLVKNCKKFVKDG
jgi:hypothetical protein